MYSQTLAPLICRTRLSWSRVGLRIAFLCTSLAVPSVTASPVRVIRTVETREPADYAMVLLHGETIDLRVRMVNYAAPVDLTGWTVTLHGQTNSQAVSESFQVAGVAGLPGDPDAAAQGWASVALSVSGWWPRDAASGRWTMVAAEPTGTVVILRAGGPLTVRGTAAADAMAPVPQSVAENLRAQWLVDIALATNAIPHGASGTATGALHAVTADRLIGTNAWSGIEHGTQVFYRVIGSTTNREPMALLSDVDRATNELIDTYFLGTNAWMTISNKTLTVCRTVDGVVSSLWSSAESAGVGLDPSFTNAVWLALSGMSAQINAKANKSWGQYAPDGSDNPDPNYMTFINSPATMHASGYQWASYGTYSVLAQSGAVAFESGENGEVRWGLDLHTNYIAFVRGGNIIIGARAQSITVVEGGTPNGYAEIIFPYTSGDFPKLWFSPLLDVPFVIQSGVVWVDNSDGTATVTAPANAPKGFWYASSSVKIDVVVESRPPVRLVGGVFGSTNVLPVVYDSTINVTSGGRTYRIPAQEVP